MEVEVVDQLEVVGFLAVFLGLLFDEGAVGFAGKLH